MKPFLEWHFGIVKQSIVGGAKARLARVAIPSTDYFFLVPFIHMFALAAWTLRFTFPNNVFQEFVAIMF